MKVRVCAVENRNCMFHLCTECPDKTELSSTLMTIFDSNFFKAEKGGGGGCHFFVTLQFNYIYRVCGESKVSFITFWIFSLLSYPFKILMQVFIVLKPVSFVHF